MGAPRRGRGVGEDRGAGPALGPLLRFRRRAAAGADRRLDAHVDAAASLVERGSLGLPYDIFVGLARFTGTGGEDGIVMIVAETDDGVRPHRLLHFSTGTATRPTSRLNQWQIGYGDSGHFFLPAEGRDAGRDREAERHFRRLALLLGLIADRRSRRAASRLQHD